MHYRRKEENTALNCIISVNPNRQYIMYILGLYLSNSTHILYNRAGTKNMNVIIAQVIPD